MALKENKDAKIKKYYQPNEEEKELLEHVYDRYYSMRDDPDRQEAEKRWDKAEKLWDQEYEKGQNREDWQADYFVPLVTSVVESCLSEMVDQSPQPLILPRSSDDKAKSTVMKHAFNYTWEVANGDLELEKVMKDMLIYGDGFAQEYYWKDRRKIKQLVGVKKNKKKQRVEDYQEKEIFGYDDCYMQSISPWEIYFDEVAEEINRGPNKARDCVRREVMKLEDAKLYFSGDVWDPLNNMRYVRAGGDTEWYRYFSPPEDIDHSDEVEVLWYWSRKPEDWLIIVANDVLIKAGPNPYKHKQLPFAKSSDVKRPHQFYHKGEPTLLESIQEELNTLRRMITDRNHLDIDKMFLMGRDQTFNDEDTIARPHGVIRVDDPAAVKPLEYNDIPRSVQYTLEQLHQDAVRVTGIEDRFQSLRQPGTATEAAILKEAVLRRIKKKLRHVEKEFLVDIGRMRVANIIQFYSQPKLEKIVGESGTKDYRDEIRSLAKQGLLTTVDGKAYRKKYRNIRIKGKELDFDEKGQVIERPHVGYSFFKMKPDYFIPTARGGFDIRFEAGSTMPVSKSLRAKQTQDATNMLMPLATAGIGYDPVKLGDEVLRSLDKDPENFKTEEPEKEITEAREQMMINLASRENEEILNGQPIPEAGTPYAGASHTLVHISFMKSDRAQEEMSEELFRQLTKHTMGEIIAQQQRGEQSAFNKMQVPQQGQKQEQQSAQGYNEEMKATIPAMRQGGEEEVQGGTETKKGSVVSRALRFLGRNR